MASRYKLLQQFESLFAGKAYRHRASNQGDWVASFLVDDLYSLGTSTKLVDRVDADSRVLNLANKTVGKAHRRGDGTFGTAVPHVSVLHEGHYKVGFAPIANVEIGTETKILAKAMIKQLDRVGTDMLNQAAEFRKHGNQPICVGLVGINHASQYTSFEGDREWVTNGLAGQRHPSQEAASAETRLAERVNPAFDEVVFLKFLATNSPPYVFSWVDLPRLEAEYGAALVRISSLYDRRF